MKPIDRKALEELERRLRVMLPEEYQDTYETMEPVPMRAAGLKYAADGQVAWDEIWGSFCDLAMAGGPPHKGALLQPGTREALAAQPEDHARAAAEICRGIEMVTQLPAEPSPVPGWIRVECLTPAMSAWLTRAIVMENVAAHGDGVWVDVPAAPHFRLDREIKNVITVMAKTCHYWLEHMPLGQQRAIADLLTALAAESPLVVPARAADEVPPDRQDEAAAALAAALRRETGLVASGPHYAGWLGLECPSTRAAIWMMRAIVVHNVLARREATHLFVPVHARLDPGGAIVTRTVTRVHGLAARRGVL